MRISDWSSDVCSSDLADMLVCNNGCWTLDEATTLFDGEAKVQPDALADLMYASLFCYSDDCGHDSWDTQSLEFEREARILANLLLLGEEEALIARMREAVFAFDRLGHLAVASQSGLECHARSEEHTSELQSLMRISYSLFCLKNKT